MIPVLERETWRGVLLGLGIFVFIWWLIALAARVPIIPSPVDVAINIGQIFAAKLQVHVWYSLGRVAGGILLSVMIGVPLGFLMGSFNRLDRMLSPLVYFTYPVPKLALLPVVMLIFGLGEASKLIMIVLIVVFQIIITSRDAVRGIPQEIFRSLRSLGAGRWQIFTEVILPATLSDVLTAIRLALGTAVSILFFTETYGTEYGMGYFVMDAWLRVNYLEMYSGIVVLSLMGLILFVVIDVVEKRLSAWR